MSFLAQIDLQEVRAAGGPDWLPGSGTLLFFYDNAWGAGGWRPEDAAGWRVLHGLAPEEALAAAFPPDLAREHRFERYGVRFESSFSHEGDELDPRVTEMPKPVREEVFRRLRALDENGPRHWIDGYADAIQNPEMAWACQLATHGYSTDTPEVFRSETGQALREGAGEWRLLLQLDSDTRMAANWVHDGRLYFWIREADARAGDFSKVWMICQFY